MEDLSLATGIGSDGNFLNGNLVDNQTLIDAFISQDFVQFFQKLASLGGITFNYLPDNETNGYQLIEALQTVVRTYAATTVLKGTVEKATTAEAQAGTVDKFLDAALLQLVTATVTRKGIAAIATDAEVLAGTDDTKIITSAKLKASNNDLKSESIAFSGWDMDANSQFNVGWTLPASHKIISMSATINAGGSQTWELASIHTVTGNINGSVVEHTTSSNEFTLERLTGGDFDQATPFNNADGEVYVVYKAI